MPPCNKSLSFPKPTYLMPHSLRWRGLKLLGPRGPACWPRSVACCPLLFQPPLLPAHARPTSALSFIASLRAVTLDPVALPTPCSAALSQGCCLRPSSSPAPPAYPQPCRSQARCGLPNGVLTKRGALRGVASAKRPHSDQWKLAAPRRPQCRASRAAPSSPSHPWGSGTPSAPSRDSARCSV